MSIATEQKQAQRKPNVGTVVEVTYLVILFIVGVYLASLT